MQYRNRVKLLETQHDIHVLRKGNQALQHKVQVSKLRICHEELLEAQIRLVEAESDVAGLEDRNKDIVRQRNEEQARVAAMEGEAKRARQAAQRAINVCNELMADPDNAPYLEQFTKPPVGTTVETLQMEIAAEESKLDYVHANNPNAIRDFERFQGQAENLREKIAGMEEKLQNIERKITKIRSRWEPELDKLISEISDAFSYNFEQIGCAGEVSVHKDDDFDLWAIQIKVKFR